MSNYFPFGFKYPEGFAHNDANPDPRVETVKHRIAFLNACHDAVIMDDGTQMPGHIFAAAMDMFQKGANMDVDEFWDTVEAALDTNEIAQIALSLYPLVSDTLPLLDFPNSIALFDCRFVANTEWEHLRRYSIGGSEVGTVLGLSHFQTARILYHEKKSPAVGPHSAGTQQIFDYGHVVEAYTIDYVAGLLGAKRYPEYRMFAHKKYPFITCNPDGILIFPDGSLALFEAKTAICWKLDDWKDGIPDYYEPQPRQYLEVLDDPRLTGGYIGCCFGALPCDMKIHSYKRDAAAGAVQIQKIVNYWHNYIVPGVLPPFSGVPELDVEAAYKYTPMATKPVGIDKTLDPANLPLFEEYFELQSRLKAVNADLLDAEATEASLMAEIKPCSADGLTLCSIPGGMTYKIKVSDYTRESVSETDLPAPVCNWLLSRSVALQDSKLDFSTPKIKTTVKKQPKTKKAKTA